MEKLPIKQLPCILCPIAKEWRLKQNCEICNYYKGFKEDKDGGVVICISGASSTDYNEK